MTNYHGKAIALIQVPNQMLFEPAADARYLGISPDTLYKYTDEVQITAYDFNGRRAYRLVDLDKLIEELPEWNDRSGRKPQTASSEGSLQNVS